MKKITKTLLVASLALVAMSCSKEDKEVVTPTLVQDNNIPNGTVKMSLSVHVLGSSSGTVRTAGLSGCAVTISNNGTNQTVTVGESGIASFSNLTEGEVSVFVKAPAGYLSKNITGFLEYDGSFNLTSTGTNGGTDAVQEFSNRIPVTLPRIGATAKGKIYGNFDFIFGNPNTTIPSNVKVIAKVDNSFEPNVFSTTTDGNGNFSFDGKLPENVEIDFYIDYQTSNAVTDPSKPVIEDWEINKSIDGIMIGNTHDFGNIDAN